ncbi:sulfatase family protein [Sediminitomix flava]|uniref:Putative sulfatase n=1 Tax=Sediminitomix flava TaxID=379075 RepID=A0A315Z551_SEDFL|nr:sulfatase [Sediminitomix flava]PWJ37945.1 putative sulfatase [Sediminitomix flava]
MTFFNFKGVFTGLAILSLPIINTSCQPEEEKKPNILFIMSDDHTAQAIGAYGSRLSKLNPTPTIDKLANEGVLFENAFCTNSICTPSRATIMTGQYSQSNGVLDLNGRLPEEQQYLPQAMKAAGYETAMIGKWHLKEEPAAYDHYEVLPVQGKYFDPVFRVRGQKEWPKNTNKYTGHSSDVITNLSLKWLDEGRDKSKPFFLMHHFKAPHDFFEFAPRYKDYLENTQIPEPSSLYDNQNNGSIATRGAEDSLMYKIGSSISKRNIARNMGQDLDIDQSLDGKAYTSASYQEYLKRYLRCVKGVDDNIQRIMDYLEKEGELDNTIIIYTGDQGMMLGEHDYQDKRWMYEESMRMPFIVYYPAKLKKGIRTDAIINNTDYAPTMIDLAEGTIPSQMQGKSFVDILETGQEPEDWRKSTYYRYWMHMAHKHANPAHFGVRTKKHKLIFFYAKHYDPDNHLKDWGQDYHFEGPVGWELYDLEKDPLEMNNVYNDPAYESVQAELKQEIIRLRKQYKEEDVAYPAIQEVIEKYWNS